MILAYAMEQDQLAIKLYISDCFTNINSSFLNLILNLIMILNVSEYRFQAEMSTLKSAWNVNLSKLGYSMTSSEIVL